MNIPIFWIRLIWICCALTLVHGCKTRVFDSGTKSFLSPTDVLNVLKTGGLVRLSPDEFKPGNKVAIYFHGRTMKPQPEPYFVELYKNVAPEWQKRGFTLYAYSWVPDSTDPSLPPFDAQDRLWSNVVQKALAEVQAELTRLDADASAPPAEVRLIGHSLGSQLAIVTAWHLTQAGTREKTNVDPKNIRLELIDPIVLCRKDCERPRKIRNAVQQYTANSSMLPIVYAANLSAIAGFSFESIAHVQEVALEWLGGGEKNILELQHSELKKAYFASISESSPRYSDRNGQPGGQAFSAALPTEELRRRAKPTFTKQFTGRGLSSRSLAKHVYMNSVLENPNEKLADLDWGKALDFLFGDDEGSNDSSSLPPPQPLPLLSEQIARNEIGLQSAQSESAQSAAGSDAPQGTSRIDELNRELEELRSGLGDVKPKATQSGVNRGAAQVQNKGTGGCIEFNGPSDYLEQCKDSLGSIKNSISGSGKWSTAQIRQINKCVGLNKDGIAQRSEYKSCWGPLFKAFHPDGKSESDSSTADKRAEALRKLIDFRSLVMDEFL
jgi:hypothetical protein